MNVCDRLKQNGDLLAAYLSKNDDDDDDDDDNDDDI